METVYFLNKPFPCLYNSITTLSYDCKRASNMEYIKKQADVFKSLLSLESCRRKYGVKASSPEIVHASYIKYLIKFEFVKISTFLIGFIK